MENKGTVVFTGHTGESKVITFVATKDQIRIISTLPLDVLDEDIVDKLFALPVIFSYLYTEED